MWTEDKRDRLRGSSLMFVFTVLLVVLFAAFAAHLSAQTPQPLPATTVTAPANFTEGQGAKVKGLIISRRGDDMVIRDEDGHVDVITLTEGTRISSPSGLFKTEKQPRDVSSLLPGLIVEVKGNGGDRGNLVADKISFHSSALRVAQQVAAGTVALSMRVGANADSIDKVGGNLEATKARIADSLAALEARARDSLAAISVRFDDIDKYDVRDSMMVTFATASSTLTDDDRQALDAVAAKAMTQDGYLIEVTGYADAVGRASSNLELSERRAEAVVHYLVKERGIPLRRLLNPTGFGEDDPAASNETPEGR